MQGVASPSRDTRVEGKDGMNDLPIFLVLFPNPFPIVRNIPPALSENAPSIILSDIHGFAIR